MFGRRRKGRRHEPAMTTSSTEREVTAVVGRLMGAEVTRGVAFLWSGRHQRNV